VSGELFQLVVIAAAGLGVVGALFAFAGSGGIYDGIGRGYLDVPDRPDGRAPPDFDSWNAEAALEIRQLLEAKAALRRRHGKRTLDATTEIHTLLRELEK
jgi:hypothetical protein